MSPSTLDRLHILLAAAESAVFAQFWFDKSQARSHGRRDRHRTLLKAAVSSR